MANLTLTDIAVLNGGSQGLVDLIEETIKASPEAKDGAARRISGTSFDTLIRTIVPSPGFRNANEGAAALKSTYKTKRAQTMIIDAPIEMDKAVADAHEDGAEAVLALEGASILEGVWRALSSQFYYGTATTVATSTAANPTKGFPGLVEVVDSALVKDAGGTNASARSSVWAVKWGPMDVQWLIGRDGEITSGDPMVVRVEDSSNNPYDSYRIPFLAYVGLKVHNINSIGRIKNLTTESGKGLTDDLLFELLELFPNGVVPDFMYMTKRSLHQLRASRTATNVTGAPAPMPDEVAGIPIRLTDGLVDTEAA